MFASNCTSCHSDPPAAGALAGLVTYADLKATSHEDPTKNEAQLSLARMQNMSSPMPPGGVPPAADATTLENWINAGYPMGSCATGGSSGSSSSGGSGGGSGSSSGSGSSGGGSSGGNSVFSNAPPFASQTGMNTHNAGKDCLQCHSGGGGAPQFSFGGTLYDGSGNAVVGAEVRLVDANGNGTSVYTGPTGTFFSGGSAFAAPAYVGARNATSTSDMLVTIASSGGGCSSCHCSGTGCATTPIHLP